MPVRKCFLSSHQHLVAELRPVLSDTFIAAPFPGLGNLADLERSLESDPRGANLGTALRESLSHCVLQSCKLTGLDRKEPSRAGPLREMPQAAGNRMRLTGKGQNHQNQGKAISLKADQTVEKCSPWRLLVTVWAGSISVYSGLFSILRE